MSRIRMTSSLCPQCYRVIPAAIAVENEQVWMEKRCPMHGWTRAVVERDPFWFSLCQKWDCRNIYENYLIDITERCNIRCEYCYFETGKEDYSPDVIVKDAEEHRHLAPFALIGGEPTMHPKLPEVYRRMAAIGPTTIVTNGIRLCDEKYLDELCGCGLLEGNVLNVGLSFHKESKGKDLEFVEICRKRKYQIPSSFFVVDDLAQIDEALEVYSLYSDVITGMRIKAAGNLGYEQGVENQLFTSDLLHYVRTKGKTDITLNRNPKMYASNKVSIASCLWEGLPLLLVSWYTVHNVDLDDIHCGPWYRAKDGNVYNLATALILNEKYYGDIDADSKGD